MVFPINLTANYLDMIKISNMFLSKYTFSNVLLSEAKMYPLSYIFTVVIN